MYPDKKQLGLLIELQSAIKENMGEWVIGDYGYIDCHEYDYTDKIGLCKYIHIYQGRTLIRLSNSLEGDYLADDERILRVPAIIDPVNPERGLWGMLDWRMWSFSYNGTAFIENEDETSVFFDDDIVTVLLRALYFQEILQKDPDK